jgi:alkanesulfonate monooxygenase SsuD/methylene tetrahydromethanopterin reductase-like flavin-dependent oxidoreductase (luciferase family)
MHFGLFSLMTQRDRAKKPREIFAEMVEQVRLVEQIGFEIAWFAEHHFSNYCVCPSPLTMATYVAPQTKRIRLGPAVVVAPLYMPLRLLEDLAVLDIVSDGRLVIGLGSGYQQYEFHKFGVDLKQSRDVFLETLDVLERYLAGGAVSYEGKHIRIPETHFSVRPLQARPEIYIAGLLGDPVTQERIAKNGYVPIFTTGWSTLEEIGANRAKVAATHTRVTGNQGDPPFAIQQYVFVTESREEALRAADAARYIRRVAMSMRANRARLDGAFLQEEPAPDEPPLETIADRLVVGDAESCAEKLIRELEALKPAHVSCFMALPGLPQDRILRSIERFGSEVLPRVAKHFGGLERVGAAPARRAAAE